MTQKPLADYECSSVVKHQPIAKVSKGQSLILSSIVAPFIVVFDTNRVMDESRKNYSSTHTPDIRFSRAVSLQL
jgi:hypothetical protein